MDGDMLDNPSTQRNLSALRDSGIHILPPDEGYLASGLVGPGRLPETDTIICRIEEILTSTGFDPASRPATDSPVKTPSIANRTGYLAGKRVLVTAGPTREPIDAVRFLSNPSTGKMGIAMARAAQLAGADVTLLLGPISTPDPVDLHTVRFSSAADLFEKVKALHEQMDIIIKTAAVADFRPKNPSTEKTPKNEMKHSIELEPTQDVLLWLSEHKPEGQILIGFAMQTSGDLEPAQQKLKRKKLEAILVNELKDGVSGFATDSNELTLITADGSTSRFSGYKEEIAQQILSELFQTQKKDHKA
jgi:phosphopantothenoylcysteine decarboxylase/phosphopantothenate--cysteine ligase